MKWRKINRQIWNKQTSNIMECLKSINVMCVLLRNTYNSKCMWVEKALFYNQNLKKFISTVYVCICTM